MSEAKAWLCGKEVFKYLFKNGREAVFQALDIIERSKVEEEILDDGTSIQQLQEEYAKLKNRLKRFQKMLADELMSLNDF